MTTPRSDRGIRRTDWVTKPCAGCGTPVERRTSEARETAYCSRACFRQRGIRRHTRFYTWAAVNIPELITEFDLREATANQAVL